jgi:uncharacterized protein (DUF111 family)
MTGEELAVSCERLRFIAGVLDVSLAGRMGKKGRPLQEVRVLVRPEALEDAISRCFSETATIGLRWRLESRRILPRAATEGPDGVRLKVVDRPGVGRTAKVESDDLAGENLAARRQAAHHAEDIVITSEDTD